MLSYVIDSTVSAVIPLYVKSYIIHFLWLGGTTPLGYESEEIKAHVDIEGRIRTVYRLKIDPTQFTIARLIFHKFLEFQSLIKTETYLLNTHIKTRNGKNFSRFGIKAILSNPVYVATDNDTLEYFRELGTVVYNTKKEFNEKYGTYDL